MTQHHYKINNLQLNCPYIDNSLITTDINIVVSQQAINNGYKPYTLCLSRIIQVVEYIINKYLYRNIDDINRVLCRTLLALIYHSNALLLDKQHSDNIKTYFEPVDVNVSITNNNTTYKYNQNTNNTTFTLESPTWGQVTVIDEIDYYDTNNNINNHSNIDHNNINDKSAGLYILHISPQQSIPGHIHKIMNECEMILSNQLSIQQQHHTVHYGTAHQWQHNVPHTYINTTNIEQSLLCIDKPKFIRSDEIYINDKCSIDVLDNAQQRIPYSIHNNTVYQFPGCYSNQVVELHITNDSSGIHFDDVLILLYNNDYTKLCFVNHNIRGYELCGGKIAHNETATQACIREVYEESGYTIDDKQLNMIGYYIFLQKHDDSNNAEQRYKVVYICNVDDTQQQTAQLHHETNDIVWFDVTDYDKIVNDIHTNATHSVLLQDNVLPLLLLYVNRYSINR